VKMNIPVSLLRTVYLAIHSHWVKKNETERKKKTLRPPRTAHRPARV
jgi:hypothetical protein